MEFGVNITELRLTRCRKLLGDIMNKEIKKIFGNRKNYLRFMSKLSFAAFLEYINKYHKIPR